MEQKSKFDLNSLIGFALIFVIILWMMMNNKTSEEKQQEDKAKQEQVDKEKKTVPAETIVETLKDTTVADTAKVEKLKTVLGSFAYSATLPSAKDEVTTIENEFLVLKVANKGGYVSEVTLKNYKRFDKNSNELVSLIKNNNSSFNLELKTNDNRILNSKDLYFEPTLTKNADSQILSMKLKAGPNEFLEYKYVLNNKNYMLDFEIQTQGLAKVLNTSKASNLEWDLKTYRNEKSISYENRYAELYFEHKDGKVDYAGLGSQEDENLENATFIAYKQHFFSSILLSDKPIEGASVHSTNLVKDEKIDTIFTKQFKSILPLAYKNGELDYKMNWYFGPTDYKILNSYDRNIEDIVQLGWGIFGWINKFIFVPLFGFLSNFMSLGIAIIIFTILIKLAMSPITFKSFLSQAKMKVLRPEISEIGEKFKKDPMKKQQETMKLYNTAGVNPMAGCIPALIQIPFVYASFQFFPSAIQLRQQSFLWADDLSSFDQIFKLPFRIPLYGDHVSLFPILAAIAIFFYMKMTSGDQAMAQPQQEGMPDMGKIMKVMIYISPLMMLIFFNSYGSGLSLYNFISNLITIGIMLVIKKYFIDSDKIHAQIQENKTKPKKESKFQKKMREMMEQAEAQKQLNKKK
ncbi:membrane protein insertase YidC [Flavobacterium capsici]|uniref:Membrane protein insertase YidC n=1 Tax=Flavobacterium capsici TaxID=3075618 RepID=A0AA96F2U5_9FLAO|nr:MULTISPECIES: membrane protein insertase YidC [unclassified Flavobacterium]WNM20175.1 membrane protein insertase YidC [Flavobacterium sp. PMR2A8]WNM21565.1 membrane protein insertase YidC [Flavobacterium sp. PMTSA4]